MGLTRWRVCVCVPIQSSLQPLLTVSMCRSYPHQHIPRISHLPSPAHLRRQRPRPGPDPILQTIQINQALPPTQNQIRRCTSHPSPFPFLPPLPHDLPPKPPTNPYPGSRKPTKPSRSQKARRTLRVHPLRLLLNLLPLVLVEQRRIPRPRRPPPIIPVDRGFAGRAHGGAEERA